MKSFSCRTYKRFPKEYKKKLLYVNIRDTRLTLRAIGSPLNIERLRLNRNCQMNLNLSLYLGRFKAVCTIFVSQNAIQDRVYTDRELGSRITLLDI